MKSTTFLHLDQMPITHVSEPVSVPVPLFDNSFCRKSQKRTYQFSDYARNTNRRHCEITRNAKSKPCSLKSVSDESQEKLPVSHSQGFQVFLNDSDAEIKYAGPVDNLMRSSCTLVESPASNSTCKYTDSLSKIVLNVPTDRLIENFDLFKFLVSRIQGESSGEEVNERNSNYIARDIFKNAPINFQNTLKVVEKIPTLKVDRASQTEDGSSRFFKVRNKGIYNLLGRTSHRAGNITVNNGTKNRKRETELSSEIDHIASTAESFEKWNHSKAQCESLRESINIHNSFSDGDTDDTNNQADDYTYVILPDMEDLASSIEITPENKAVSIVNSSVVNKDILPQKIDQFEDRIRNSLKVLEMTDVTWEGHDMGTAALINSEQDLFDWSTETAETESADEPSSSDMRENDSNIVDMDSNGSFIGKNTTTEILGVKRKRKRKKKFTSIKRKRQCIERKSVNVKQRSDRIVGHFSTGNRNINADSIHGKHGREDTTCKKHRQTSHNQKSRKNMSELRQCSRRSRRRIEKVSKYQFCCKGYFTEFPFRYKEPLRKSQRIKYLEDTVGKGWSASHQGRNKVKKRGVKLSRSVKNLPKVRYNNVNSSLKSVGCKSYHFRNSIPECNEDIKETVNGNVETYHVALKRKKDGKLFKKDLRKFRSKMILHRYGEKNLKFNPENHANQRAKEKLQQCEASADLIVGIEVRKPSTPKNISVLQNHKNNGLVEQSSFKNISKECIERSGGKVMQKTSVHGFEDTVQNGASCQKLRRSARNKSIRNNMKCRKQKSMRGPLCEKNNHSPYTYLKKTTSKSIKCCSKVRQLTHFSVGTEKQKPEQEDIQTRSEQLVARKDFIRDAKAIDRTRKKILCETQINKQCIVKTQPHSKMLKCQSCNYMTHNPFCLKRHEDVHLMAKTVQCKICQISFKSSMSMKQWHSRQKVQHSNGAPIGTQMQSEDTDSSVEIIRTADRPERSFVGGDTEVCSFKKDIKDLKTQTQVENISFKNGKHRNTVDAQRFNKSDKLKDQNLLSKIFFSNKRIINKNERPLNENKRTWNEKTNLDAVLLLDKIPVNIGTTVFVKGTEERIVVYKRNQTGEFTITKSLPEEDTLLTVENLETEREEDYSDEEEMKPPDLLESCFNSEDLVNPVGQNVAYKRRGMPKLTCVRMDSADLNLLGNCYDGTDTSNQKKASTKSAGHSGEAEGNDQNRNQSDNLNIGQSDKGGCKSAGEDRDKDDDNNNNGRKGDKMDSRDMGMFSCLVCSASFCQKSDLMKHLSKIHRLTNLCTLCYFENSKIQRFSNPVTLRNHKLRAHQKDMVKCVCGTLLVDNKMLTTHLKKFRCNTASEDNKQDELIRCVCGKRFGNKQMLSDHKMFKCRKRDGNQDMSVRYNKKTETMKNPDQNYCNMVDKTIVAPVPLDQVVRGFKEVPKVLSEITQIDSIDSATRENYIEVQGTSKETANDLNNNTATETTFSADTEMNTDNVTHPEEVLKSHMLQKYELADTNQNMTITEMGSNSGQYALVDININEERAKMDLHDKQAARIDDMERETLEEDCTKTRIQDGEPAAERINRNCISAMKDTSMMRTENGLTNADMNMNTTTITVIAEVHNDFSGNIEKDDFQTPATPAKGENLRNVSIKGVKIKYDTHMKRHCMNAGMGGFPCRVCGRRFKRPYLYIHMKQVHGREEWPCFKSDPKM